MQRELLAPPGRWDTPSSSGAWPDGWYDSDEDRHDEIATLPKFWGGGGGSAEPAPRADAARPSRAAERRRSAMPDPDLTPLWTSRSTASEDEEASERDEDPSRSGCSRRLNASVLEETSVDVLDDADVEDDDEEATLVRWIGPTAPPSTPEKTLRRPSPPPEAVESCEVEAPRAAMAPDDAAARQGETSPSAARVPEKPAAKAPRPRLRAAVAIWSFVLGAALATAIAHAHLP